MARLFERADGRSFSNPRDDPVLFRGNHSAALVLGERYCNDKPPVGQASRWLAVGRNAIFIRATSDWIQYVARPLQFSSPHELRHDRSGNATLCRRSRVACPWRTDLSMRVLPARFKLDSAPRNPDARRRTAAIALHRLSNRRNNGPSRYSGPKSFRTVGSVNLPTVWLRRVDRASAHGNAWHLATTA